MKSRLSMLFESKIEFSRHGLCRGTVRAPDGTLLHGDWHFSVLRAARDLRPLRIQALTLARCR